MAFHIRILSWALIFLLKLTQDDSDERKMFIIIHLKIPYVQYRYNIQEVNVCLAHILRTSFWIHDWNETCNLLLASETTIELYKDSKGCRFVSRQRLRISKYTSLRNVHFSSVNSKLTKSYNVQYVPCVLFWLLWFWRFFAFFRSCSLVFSLVVLYNDYN